jgi:uncharacterized iron-regulated protein
MTTIDHHPGIWVEPGTGAFVAHHDLIRRMAGKQAVLLGETHDRADIHRWQLHVLAGLHALRPDIVVGFEMFPRRVQPALDAWVAGRLGVEAFLEQADWKTVWNFPPELYLPIFEFCRQFRLPMKALNYRRALVTEVGKLGWDAIPFADRDGVTPSKPATEGYRQYLSDLMGAVGRRSPAADPATGAISDRFIRAQQTWDRAFACGIADVLASPRPPLVVGIIGRGHLEYGHGTPYQLADLGVSDVAVLLPSHEPTFDASTKAGIAEAIFRLD